MVGKNMNFLKVVYEALYIFVIVVLVLASSASRRSAL
jgi:hypothetical protein